MLDIDHGTYPFVTSSSATSGGASIGTGVPPNSISTVIGVTKADRTRVGEGPFPSEIQGEIGAQIQTKGSEFGAVTGTPPPLRLARSPPPRYSNMINGTGWLVVTKLDVLDDLAEIPIVTGYKSMAKPSKRSPRRTPATAKSSPSSPLSPAGSRTPTEPPNTPSSPKKRRISELRPKGIRRQHRHDLHRPRPRPHHLRPRVLRHPQKVVATVINFSDYPTLAILG